MEYSDNNNCKCAVVEHVPEIHTLKANIVNSFSTTGVVGCQMLRIIQNTSSAGSKSYFSAADYYSEGQELEGIWRGKGADRLGLNGKIEPDAWDALCDNLNPNTKLPLTVRQKKERRVGYDFNFHAPKSLSLLYSLTGDDRLLDAFRASVHETMCEMEAEMQTRVRLGGRNEDRITGELVWGEFIHFTSRPVDGVPCPHLHAHAFAFNTTWDSVEKRWKAGQFAGIKKDASYFEAVFHSKLSQYVSELGQEIARTKTGWEIAGFDRSTLAKFSRRTAQIEKLAKEKGITSEAEKSALGAKTREKKNKNLTLDQLRSEWRGRLSSDEERIIHKAGADIQQRSFNDNDRAAHEAAFNAVEHCFERESVIPERKLFRKALQNSFGQASRHTVESAVSQQNLIRGDRGGRRFVTSQEVLAEEMAMLAFARNGKSTLPALVPGDHTFVRDWLNQGQKAAVLYVLTSCDRVILIRGAAGVGKTTMMMEAAEAIRASGSEVYAFADSAGASRGVLRDAGFDNADTIARLLADEKLQEQLRGQVLWVDESSLVGVRTMKRLFDLADKVDCRVVLSGDRYQHGSVERGSALRLLEEEAGLKPAEILEIQRQTGRYKKAVKALSEGRIDEGFRQLNAMGSIREIKYDARYKALASEYVASAIEGKDALVISPTHLEGEAVTDEIRTALRQARMLGNEQRLFHVLENANLTVAERGDPVNYLPGDTVIFHQNAPGYRKCDHVVAGQAVLPLRHAQRFTTFRPALLSLSPGDRIRITRNGKSKEGKRLNNGDLFTVKNFTRDGDIALTCGATIDSRFSHISHGYVVTSHASQGKSVQKVIIAQSSEFDAASAEQFYVSVSRGKESVSIFTDDRHALLESVRRSDERISATEFINAEHHRGRVAVAELQRSVPEQVQLPDRTREGIINER